MEIDEALDRVAGTPDAELAVMAEDDFSLHRALAMLVLHGRETGAWGRATENAESNLHGGPNEYCYEGWQEDAALLRALAGEPEDAGEEGTDE